MKVYFTLLLLFTFHFTIIAQNPLPEFADFTADEYGLKECALDSSAEAVILFEEGFTVTGKLHTLETYRRIRMKILTEKGISRANIRLPYISKDDYERISEIKAVSCTMDESGEYIKTYINKKDIFTNRIDDFASEVKFAIPNCRQGTIFEFSFLRTTATVTGIRDWYFQSDLPTLKSRFTLGVPSFTEVTYKVEHLEELPVSIKKRTMDGTVFFEMLNIPAFKPEPYMDAPVDYLQKVKFMVSGFVSLTGQRTYALKNWRVAGEVFAEEMVYRDVFRSDFKGAEDLKQIVAIQPSVKSKISAVYEFVKNRIIWNGHYGLLPSGSLKEVWERRKGNAGEINLLLLNLLNLLDIPASPLLVAENDFGNVDSTYPSFNYFNKTVVYAEIDGHRYILDASKRHYSMESIPSQLLNTFALLVDRKKSYLFRITSQGQSYKKQVFIEGVISNQGVLKGSAWLNFEEYAAVNEAAYLKNQGEDQVRASLQEQNEGLLIEKFDSKIPENNGKVAVSEEISFNVQYDLTDHFLFINTNLLTGFSRNPFVSKSRLSGINFYYPFVVNIQMEFSLPEGTVIEKIPENKSIVTEQRKMVFARIIKPENEKLIIKYTFTQSQSYYIQEEYGAVKKFYEGMVDLLNDPVVLKIK